MVRISVEQLWKTAEWHQQNGRVAEAEGALRRLVAQEPGHGEAWHQLGILAAQTGRMEAAVECMNRSIGCMPTNAMYLKNLGLVLLAGGRGEEAIGALRRAVAVEPGFAEAHYNLGNALATVGRAEEAIESYRQALRLDAAFPDALNNLGVALQAKGELEEAVACFRRAIATQPDHLFAHNSLGNVLRAQGQLEEAGACFRRAIAIQPAYAEAHTHLGVVLNARGEIDGALACHQRALQLDAGLDEAHVNLGWSLHCKARFDEAIASFRRAIKLRPSRAEAYRFMGLALKHQGRIDEAISNLREAVRQDPGNAAAHSDLAYALHFHEAFDAKGIFQEHQRWNERHAAALKKTWRPHGNTRDAERRLRVGYVSPNLGEHVAGRFLRPLLDHYDRERFEVFCYEGVAEPAAGSRAAADADHWRSIGGLTDERAAEKIREDGIDILVDLSAHTDGSRLLIFARKPAPVQVMYLAYCSTSGLEAMDYRLSDPYMEPEGVGAECYAEETLRLPESYWCYEPMAEAPAVSALPAERAGRVTFGCLNFFGKASPGALGTWAKVLRAVPESRLIVHAYPGSHRERAARLMGDWGIAAGRIEFVGHLPTAEYLAQYGRIDIALDPFPYAGGATTCDALWMGVPVVTLAGRTAVGRGGVSILSNVGLEELIARDEAGYVEVAAGLARDLGRLKELRATLRERMRGSALMDGARFARGVEGAYREMWRRWCQRVSTTGSV